MKIGGCGLFAGHSLSLGLAAQAAVAPLPTHRKQVMCFGWDTLGSTTDDVYRNRGKFAATGFDGIGFVIGGDATPEASVKFDDISIYRW